MTTDWIKAFRSFNVPPTRYALQYVLPLLAAGGLVAFLAARVLVSVSPMIRIAVVVVAPLLCLWVAFSIPQMHADRKRRQIDNNIHFYITHMGVLATANLPPVDILSKLGEKKEYGALAELSEEIASLVRSWNMGLPEAVRFVSDRTHSLIFSDFLERFAYALETGENLMEFLKSEQAVVVGDYATQYQANLYGVDSVKDMYMSTMMSVIFLVIFGIISPVLTGVDPGALTWLVAAMVLLLEGIFLILLVMRAPNDLLWSSSEERVGLRKQLGVYLPVTMALVAVVLIVATTIVGLEMHWALAFATLPLMAIGYAASRHEANILRKDDNYPAFIRSLGASTSARGGSPKEVLKRLRRHDFGPLTNDVEALYRRLNLRLDDAGAWVRFAHESTSNVIDKFTAMFTEGIAAGGDAAETGRIVSDNVVRILSLRKHRVQSAAGFRGMMLGLTAGMAGTLYIGVGLLDVLDQLFQKGAQSVGSADLGVALADVNVDIGFLTMLITFVMTIHNLAGSFMVTKAGGGSPYKMALYVPAFMWITAFAALGAKVAMGSLS